MRNIILIGMPGSGKTSFGKVLSKRLNLSYIDMDIYIEETMGQPIPEIFEKGENYFREQETKASHQLSNKENTVIATGGGVVVKEASIQPLRKNGLVIFLDRSVNDIEEDIHKDSRPLLKDGQSKLQSLYDERIALYEKYADIRIKNAGRFEDVLNEIIQRIEKERKNK